MIKYFFHFPVQCTAVPSDVVLRTYINVEFSVKDRVLIKVLRQEKGYHAKKLITEFYNKPWTLKRIVA